MTISRDGSQLAYQNDQNGDHVFVMAAGLILAIVMMAFAANAIAPLLRRWRWLNYAGLALIAFVAVKMVVEGSGVGNVLRASLLP